MTQSLDVNQLQAQLPNMSDDDLLGMLEDIKADPNTFRDHVGIQSAATFTAALLVELQERHLMEADDLLPKDSSARGPLRIPSRQSFASGLFREEAETQAQTPVALSRQQRRLRERKAQKALQRSKR